MPAFDPAGVLAHPPALAALGRLADGLRAAGYANEPIDGPAHSLAELALGHPAPLGDLDVADATALVDAGAADVDDATLQPRFVLFAQDGVLVVVPMDGGYASERVYFGRDSLWLADLAARVGPGGSRLADLGTGAGAVAALLADRYDVVVATDVLPRTAACAALTLALNRRNDGRPPGAVCLADVTAGLRPGSFDLVTANPPWVPDRAPDPEGRHRVFAEGGETGFELPRRFVAEAVALLRAGGVSVTLTIDVTWRDGRRPLPALARGYRRLGLDVAIVPTEADRSWPQLAPELLDRFPDMAAVRHVALLVGRPDRRAGDPAAPTLATAAP